MQEDRVNIWQPAFWNPRKAATRLETGVMSGGEKFSYVWLGVLGMSIALESGYYLVPIGPAHLDAATSFFYIATSLLGLWYMYHRHNTADSFIERMTIVSVSAFFWVFGLILIPYFVLSIALYAIFFPGIDPEMGLTMLDVILEIPAVLILYWYLGRYFGSRE